MARAFEFSPPLAELSPPGRMPLLEGELSGWPHLIACAAIFVTLGIVTGYFIWRKGQLQTIDVETEIRKTGDDLAALREDLELENLELGPNVLQDSTGFSTELGNVPGEPIGHSDSVDSHPAKQVGREGEKDCPR